MIITIGGQPGAGKSTISTLLAARLGFEHYYAGKIYREMAAREGVSPLLFTQMVQGDPRIDEEIDRRFIELSRTGRNYIMEGWVAFHFFNDSYDINLIASEDERAHRIFQGDRKAEAENVSLAKTKENNAKRYRESVENFIKKYQVNISDSKNYDQTIDTTFLSPDQVVQMIVTHKNFLRFIKRKNQVRSGNPNV